MNRTTRTTRTTRHMPFKIFRVTGHVVYTSPINELVIGTDRIDAQLRMINRAKAEAAARVPSYVTLETVHIESSRREPAGEDTVDPTVVNSNDLEQE
jgi:hypothetical protein